MRKKISRWLCVFSLVALIFGCSFMLGSSSYADEEEGGEEEKAPTGTSISITPVSKILQIASDQVYKETFTANNDGDSEMKIEAYAAPYSYVYSDEEDLYKLGFTNENNYTQITRWITFKDPKGNYVERANYTIEPHGSVEITFKISTPSSIPDGGQYAVIFAHTISSTVSASGIRTEASPGLVVYGRSIEGESIISPEISDVKISEVDGNVVGSAKIKNSGNVDFNARGVLKVDPIIGFGSYETPQNSGRLSVIPDAELVLSNAWEETPAFGIYKATFTVTIGETTETTERIIIRMPLFVIVSIIILLTFLTIWIIIRVRKRKERRSRLAI